MILKIIHNFKENPQIYIWEVKQVRIPLSLKKEKITTNQENYRDSMTISMMSLNEEEWSNYWITCPSDIYLMENGKTIDHIEVTEAMIHKASVS